MWFSRWRKTNPNLDSSKHWEHVIHQPTGGLTEFGFSEDESYFLVCSHAGRGLFDCSNGQRVARDYDPHYPERESNAGRYVEGIGPLSSMWVRVHGLWSGKLNAFCPGGWKVELVPDKSSDKAFVVDLNNDKKYLVDEPITEVRAFGFSVSGRYLALATSSDVVVYEYTK